MFRVGLLLINEQQACSKHVEVYHRNKLIANTAYYWFMLYSYITMHGQQNMLWDLKPVMASI